MDLSNPKKRKTEEENGTATVLTPPGVATATNLYGALSPDDIRKILLPFTRDQLLDLLQSATLRHTDVLDAVRSVADSDTTTRKLFVRGLSGETTTETLRSVFSAFGELEEAIVIMDKNSGKSKGYGFVTFKHVDGAVVALKEPSKKIDGRMTVTQLAAAGLSGGSGGNSGHGGGMGSSADVSARKIFVGNVPFDLSSEKLLSHFAMYGEIEEGPLGFDKSSGKSKGFAFFVYKTEEDARAALAEPMKTVDGHQLICKLALDNKKSKQGVSQNEARTGFGGNVMPPQLPPIGGYPNSMMGPQYGAGHGGLSSYGGYGAGHQGQPPIAGGNTYGLQSVYGPQVQSSFNATNGAYGGSQYGGPVSGEFGAKPPASVGYADGARYGYASSVIPGQQQPVSQLPRLPPGGMYQGMPPY